MQRKESARNPDMTPDQINNIKREVRKQVANWVNTPSRTDQGFYPLHYASFHGQIKLIKLLVRNGANVWVKNKMGINMMHVAAQGDQAFSLTYFREKGISINSTDDEGSTPLHWACFAGSDTASYYLQSWGSKVNAQDTVGNTPLHLAVRSAEHFPNTRAIKELLIKGASRTITEENGLKPVDLIDEIRENDQLKDELKILLDKQPTHLPCCHFRQPMQKIEQNNKTLALCEFMLWGTFIGMVIFVFPYINGDGWFPFLSLLFFSSQIFFTLTAKADPGFMRGRSQIPFIRLVEKFDPNMLCPACEVICTADSRHCYICNQCVERFDHHCPWVNNCIGINNHSYFYLYIVT